MEKFCGRVTLWNERRLWGFIESAETLPFGEKQIFVHAANCVDAISLGAYCEFEVAQPFKLGRKPQAVNVTLRKNAAGLDVLAQAEVNA
jgi:cold shock CspA family protein